MIVKRKRRFPILMVLLLLFLAIVLIILMVQSRGPVDTKLFPAGIRQAAVVEPEPVPAPAPADQPTTEEAAPAPVQEPETEAAPADVFETEPAEETPEAAPAPAEPAEPAAPAAPSAGSVVDTGVIKTVCPDGWMYFEQTDVFGEQDAEGNYPVDPSKMGFCKGATSHMDVFSKLTTYVYYRDYAFTDSIQSMGMMWYEETEEFTTVINGITCSGFHARSQDVFNEEDFYEYDIVYYPIDDSHHFEIDIMTSAPSTGDTVSVDDPDVQAILTNLAID